MEVSTENLEEIFGKDNLGTTDIWERITDRKKRAKEAVPLCGGEAQLGRVMVSGRRGQRPTTGLRQRALDPASGKGLASFTEVVKERGG